MNGDTREPSFSSSILLGGGKQAELLVDLLDWSGLAWRSLRVFDDRLASGPHGPRGLAVEGDLAEGLRRAIDEGQPVLIALGSKQAALRDCLHEELTRAGAILPAVIHPSTLAAPSAVIEAGAAVFAGCTIGPRARVGRGATLCQGVVLEHDTEIGRNAWMGPRSATSGLVAIGEHSFVGAGAIVTREARVGARTVVGAGALVLGDLPDDCLAFGAPARVRGPVRAGMDAPRAGDWLRHESRFRPSLQELTSC
jgi:sugar O-acyltransferase (sialic acid O-acetyltransferase NeuD family)